VHGAVGGDGAPVAVHRSTVAPKIR
jgi:hypothetical protein